MFCEQEGAGELSLVAEGNYRSKPQKGMELREQQEGGGFGVQTPFTCSNKKRTFVYQDKGAFFE